eukprot:TRINITY_DN859_c0_g1_i1.p1 TRINITY_DN859_c0_g1~~TRINITY_DN859_c0_g1_i1.p1  ORF type:complete len:461 (+),score=169.01 TRINITY_DN859_c0_g1_i1:58-1383(+)
MDEEYDCIILGTGLKECIISGVLSVEGKKVLHLDRNKYYGGECASLNLTQLFQKFYPDQKVPENAGASRDFNVDLVPKFLMATGLMVKFLLKTGVTRYLDFQAVQGSYVYKDKKIHQVPTTATEAMSSGLMGFFEKRRCADFLSWAANYDVNNPKTWDGFDINKQTMAECYKKFGLDENTQSFIGHAIALYLNDEYISRKACETVERIILYKDSLLQYGGKSPFIYPKYGLGELPQAFARLSAVYGGTYMLDKPVEEIVYDSNGKVCGVKSEGEVAKCKFVVGDPSYFNKKTKSVGKVIRMICVLNHPVPNTNNEHSVQIILPQRELKRKNDIFVIALSSTHCVVPKGKYVAIVSTNAETEKFEEEIKPGLALLGEIEMKFLSVIDLLEPIDDGTKDQVFVSAAYDGISHFETDDKDVLAIYKRITGKDMDLTPKPEDDQQ